MDWAARSRAARASGAGLALGRAQAVGAAGVRRRALLEVQGGGRRRVQVQVRRDGALRARLGCGLRSALELVVRRRARRAPLHPRDGARARGQAAGPAGKRADVHPVPRRADHAEGAPRRRVARGAGRARRPDRRNARCLRLLGDRRGHRPRLLHRHGVRRVLPEPLQPLADRPARRRPRGRSAAPGVLARRPRRPRGPDDRRAEPDPDPDPDHRRHGALEPVEPSRHGRGAGVLRDLAGATHIERDL